MKTVGKQIFSYFSVVAIVTFVLIMGWLLLEVEPRYRESIEEQLVDTSIVLSSLVATRSDGTLNLRTLEEVIADAGSRAAHAQIFDVKKDALDLLVYVTDAQGMLLYDSQEKHQKGSDFSQWRDIALTLKGQYGARTTFMEEGNRESMTLIVAAPILIEGKLRGVLSVGKSLRGVAQFIYRARLRVALISCLILSALLCAAYLLARRISMPIQKLTEYAQTIEREGQAGMPRFETEELHGLSVAIDRMYKKIAGRQYLKKMLDAFSHEMKSPVAAITGAAEILSNNPPPEEFKRFSQLIQQQTSRITVLLHKLLELARLENSSAVPEPRTVDMTALVKDIVANFQPLFDAKKVSLSVSMEGNYFAIGDAEQLSLAVTNLIQNALDFTSQGGTVEVSLEKHIDRVSISVKDSGTGIPEYALERIFDRYYSLERPDTKQKSTGLGLALVREIALLHHGSVTVSNQTSGGCIATLTILCSNMV